MRLTPDKLPKMGMNRLETVAGDAGGGGGSRLISSGDGGAGRVSDATSAARGIGARAGGALTGAGGSSAGGATNAGGSNAGGSTNAGGSSAGGSTNAGGGGGTLSSAAWLPMAGMGGSSAQGISGWLFWGGLGAAMPGSGISPKASCITAAALSGASVICAGLACASGAGAIAITGGRAVAVGARRLSVALSLAKAAWPVARDRYSHDAPHCAQLSSVCPTAGTKGGKAKAAPQTGHSPSSCHSKALATINPACVAFPRQFCGAMSGGAFPPTFETQRIRSILQKCKCF